MAKLNSLSIVELQKEIRRRQRKLPRLENQRRKLLVKLARIDGAIAELGGTPSRGRRGRPVGSGKRPKNKAPLGDTLVKVLHKEKPMKVSDIVQSVKSSGYRTTSANFSTIVNQTLIKDKRFKSAGRGLYVLA